MLKRSHIAICVVAMLLISLPSFAGAQGVDFGVFRTPVVRENLLPAKDAEWLDGKELPIDSMQDQRHRALWTQSGPSASGPILFGKGASTGVRHFRLAFSSEVPVGSVLAVGNARVSVLKAGVQGHGDLANDAHWTPAERLDGRSVTTDQPSDISSIQLWTLPPGTKTRAIRFTHLPPITAGDFAGRVGGVYVLADRYADVAKQGRILTSSNTRDAGRIIDGYDNRGRRGGDWANRDRTAPVQPNEPRVSSADPVDVILAFPTPASVRGLALWDCGGTAGEIAVAPPDVAGIVPTKTSDQSWATTRSFDRLADFYDSSMRANFVDLGSDHQAGGVRMRFTEPVRTDGLHVHLRGHHADGRRVWLGELIMLASLGDRPLKDAILPEWPAPTANPPIAIPFKLEAPRHVTMVIEDASGKRIRNLLADVPYPAGDHVAWWDGTDDLGRDVGAAEHGLYNVPGTPVAPGTYYARGLTVPKVGLRYEMSPDDAGTPPWLTPDNTGGWGTNHTPPSAAAFVPADRNVLNEPLVFIGSYVSEGGHGLFWVDRDGRKRGGVGHMGGSWTGAQTLATDIGPKSDPQTAIYVASGFQGEVRFTSMTRDFRERVLVKIPLRTKVPLPGKPEPVPDAIHVNVDVPPGDACQVGDLAAHDGLVVASLPAINELWVVDAAKPRLLARVALEKPHGIAFNKAGELLAVSGDKIVRLDLPATLRQGSEVAVISNMPQKPVVAGLDDPRHLELDLGGNLIVSEWGKLHQVRVYSPAGKLVRSIGKPGAPAVGPYDQLQCNRPSGAVMDTAGRYWITEGHFQPKRVSRWSKNGDLEKAWYGPSAYGGGGMLDPFDRTLFYNGGMAFRLDWEKQTATLERVLWPHPQLLSLDERPQVPTNRNHSNGLPENAHRVDGRRFFSNWTNCSPTGGSAVAVIWEDIAGKLKPVAAMGNPWDWELLAKAEFASIWPKGTSPQTTGRKVPLWCAWLDRNNDGVVQANEVDIRVVKDAGQQGSGGVTVQRDLAFVLRVEDRVLRFPAKVGKGLVTYDFDAPEVLNTGAQQRVSTGGDVHLLTADNRLFSYPAVAPYSRWSIGGGKVGEATWSYPNLWPGLHPSHHAPVSEPGMLTGTTRLIGHDITPRGGEAGPLIFLNENLGQLPVFTSDGLLVTKLFHDARVAPHWRMPAQRRGMSVDGLTLGEECFWPSVVQLEDDGSIVLCTGAHSISSLVVVEGLDQIVRLPCTPVHVDEATLAKCVEWREARERERQSLEVPKHLVVPIRESAVQVDGDLSEWAAGEWAEIDNRGTRAWFQSSAKPYAVSASAQIAGDRLYLAWQSENEKPLTLNSAERPTAPFKTGSALDLMLSVDPDAPQHRKSAVAGDLRLIVTRKPDGKTWAMLYRAVVPGTPPAEKVPFSSPWRTITFDAVEDVSSVVELANRDGNYEVSVPLATLGLKPASGMRVKGDLGVLRGESGITTQRVYWSNKATVITADVPDEATLQPGLWGTFELR